MSDYVLVPKEPTPEMIEAGWASATDENAALVWRDMLAAAPSAWRDIRLHIQRILQTKGMGDFGVRQALDEIETILFPPPIPGREEEMSNGSE